MILTESVYVTINPRNYEYYKTLGYDDIMVGYDILINISELSRGSHVLIKCKCDKCGIEKNILYKAYLSYNNNFGNYLCRKCAQYKLEETNMIKYGVKYPLQNKDILNKMEETMLNEYGVKNASQDEEIQKKKIKTNRKKYHCDWGLANKSIIDKCRKTKLKKKGIDFIS